MQQLLAGLDTGGLIVHPVPVADRLNALLTSDAPELQTLRQRVRVVGLALEAATPRCFERIGLALVPTQAPGAGVRRQCASAGGMGGIAAAAGALVVGGCKPGATRRPHCVALR